jgi:hypothetical protein
MYQELGISNETIDRVNNAEESLTNEFKEVDRICTFNS